MPHLQALHWDYQDQLTEVELNGTGDKAYYNYDGSGQRVRKVVVKSGQRTERLYLGGVERYREYSTGGAVKLERWTVQIDDIAQVDTLTVNNSSPVTSPVPLIRYQYRDHLGSASMETNEVGDVISYEEYHPFGTSAYRVAKSGTDLSLKRYRFTNKERDDETGLYYFGVRYYAAWLGRWTSSDPVKFVDEEGYEGELPTDESALAPGPDHWVKKKSDTSGKSIIYWDDKAIDQASTKEGEEYLGEYHIHNDIDGSIYTFLPDGVGSHYRSEQALAGLENCDALFERKMALEDSWAEGQAQFMDKFNERRSRSGRFALDLTITGLTLISPLPKVGLSSMGKSALTLARTKSVSSFAINGLKQGAINLSLSYAGNLAAYGGSFADAYDNLDLADGAVGFVTGGFVGKYSIFGSFYNVIGGSLIDYEPGEGYKTFGGFFGGKKKDPWKVIGDILFNSIGLGLEMNLSLRHVWKWSKIEGVGWVGKDVLPGTFANQFSQIMHGFYGLGVGDFLNETFNNTKPKVIEEYGFNGTKRR